MKEIRVADRGHQPRAGLPVRFRLGKQVESCPEFLQRAFVVAVFHQRIARVAQRADPLIQLVVQFRHVESLFLS